MTKQNKPQELEIITNPDYTHPNDLYHAIKAVLPEWDAFFPLEREEITKACQAQAALTASKTAEKYEAEIEILKTKLSESMLLKTIEMCDKITEHDADEMDKAKARLKELEVDINEWKSIANARDKMVDVAKSEAKSEAYRDFEKLFEPMLDTTLYFVISKSKWNQLKSGTLEK